MQARNPVTENLWQYASSQTASIKTRLGRSAEHQRMLEMPYQFLAYYVIVVSRLVPPLATLLLCQAPAPEAIAEPVVTSVAHYISSTD